MAELYESVREKELALKSIRVEPYAGARREVAFRQAAILALETCSNVEIRFNDVDYLIEYENIMEMVLKGGKL